MVMSLAAAAQESHDFNRGRCQRCGDEICEGDTVVVPTPMKHTMAIGRVVEIRHYPKDQIPKDIAQAQEILGLAKETE